MKILVADDHPMFRDALDISLLQEWPDATIVGLGSLEPAEMAGLLHEAFDLIVLDWRMPGTENRDPITLVREAGIAGPIAVVSGADDLALVVETLRCGARAFLPKTMPRKALVQALRLVVSGGSVVPVEIALELAASPEGHGDEPSGEDDATEMSSLTEREQQVLTMLSTGATNKEIGRLLGLQEVTIKLHTRRILKKLGARNRTDAVRRAQEAGFIGPGSQDASPLERTGAAGRNTAALEAG